MSRGPILIVYDDLDIREILADTLKEGGFEVITAANGFEALTLVRRMTAPPSAILLDLMMPVMDGYTFLEVRRKDPALASIPLAVATAGRSIDRDRIGSGAAIVQKPFNVPELLRVLHQLASSPRGSA